MVWPIDDLTAIHLDAGTDDPKQARPELLAHINKFKTVLSDPAITEVATIAALKALAIPSSAVAVNVQGYSSSGDGGGGLFLWDSASSDADNGGTILIPNSSPANGRWRRFYSGPLNVQWFGAIPGNVVECDGPIKNTIIAAALAKTSVHIPGGLYRINTGIRISTVDDLGDKILPFPAIRGEGGDATEFWNANRQNGGTVLRYHGASAGVCLDIAGSSARQYNGGSIQDITIEHNNLGSPKEAIGLRLFYAINFRYYNLSVKGFNVGVSSSWSFSSDYYGLVAVQNNTGAIFGEHSNATGIFGAQLHQNANLGIKITGGNNFILNRATVEGQPYGIVVIREYVDFGQIHLQNIYSEETTQAAIKIGEDETGAINGTYRTIDVHIQRFNGFGTTPIQSYIVIENSDNISIQDPPSGQIDPVEIGDGCKDIFVRYVDTFGFDPLASKNADKNALLRPFSTNLIPGMFDGLVFGAGWQHNNRSTSIVGTSSDVIKRGVYNNETVLLSDIPTGGSTIYTSHHIRVTDEMKGQRYSVSARWTTSSASVSATLRIYNNDRLTQYQAATQTVTGTTLQTKGTYFTIPAAYAGGYIEIALTAANSTGSLQKLYIAELVVANARCSEIRQNELDYSVGLSGITQVGAGLSKTIVLDSRFVGTSFMPNYAVQVTPQANATAYAVPGDGSFVIHASADVKVAWRVDPFFATKSG